MRQLACSGGRCAKEIMAAKARVRGAAVMNREDWSVTYLLIQRVKEEQPSQNRMRE